MSQCIKKLWESKINHNCRMIILMDVGFVKNHRDPLGIGREFNGALYESTVYVRMELKS